MRREKESMLRLEPCESCGYVACVCFALKHAADCSHRAAVLNPAPIVCVPHGVIACDQCHPCTCPLAPNRQRWMANQIAQWEAAKAAEAKTGKSEAA